MPYKGKNSMKKTGMLVGLLLLGLCTSQIQANIFSPTNKTSWVIDVCLHYALCSEDCWIRLQPAGSKDKNGNPTDTRDFHAGGCKLTMFEAGTKNRAEGNINTIMRTGMVGNVSWDILYDEKTKQLYFKPTSSSVSLGQDILGGFSPNK